MRGRKLPFHAVVRMRMVCSDSRTTMVSANASSCILPFAALWPPTLTTALLPAGVQPSQWHGCKSVSAILILTQWAAVTLFVRRDPRTDHLVSVTLRRRMFSPSGLILAKTNATSQRGATQNKWSTWRTFRDPCHTVLGSFQKCSHVLFPLTFEGCGGASKFF